MAFQRLRLLSALLVVACTSQPEPIRQPSPSSKRPRAAAPAPEPAREPEPASPEASLGVSDTGIFSDLDARVQLAPPAPKPGEELSLLVDRRRGLLLVYVDGWPRKIYPLGGSATLTAGSQRLALRSGDAAELAPLAARARVSELASGNPPPGDHDRDGIPDPLDILIGAHKAALNAAEYDDAYFTLGFPGGDPPRSRGACVDVVVRSVRNAGLDLQATVLADVRAAPGLFGQARPDPNIDHRRVRTVLVHFRRHWRAASPALDDARDPVRIGDVILLDTFPNRPGPDHIGVVSELPGESGHPLLINNWTFGYTTRPMDLLGTIPVTHRFRFPSKL